MEQYIRACSLWAHFPDGRDVLLVPKGEMTVEALIEPRSAPFGTVFFLRFVEPLSLEESGAVLAEEQRVRREPENRFTPGWGRLARGGMLARVADALFSLSLLLRGRVPGAVAAAAALQYREMLRRHEVYRYYGRVVRQNGWIVLQYWFFYAYNSWRSGFRGVNDHESDWEMIAVYAYEQDGAVVPEWVAYASHDYHGDDLRRHWEDRGELDMEEGHPVVYAAAGSHAAYFRPGEYQTEVRLPLPHWLSRGLKAWNTFWTRTLGQARRDDNPFRIPFVDYARGDGVSIGPDQARVWSPEMIDDETPWVSRGHGLWGLFARDPISGENAPAGPMYNRDGSPSGSWYDPLGFAGLDKAPPPPAEAAILDRRLDELRARDQAIETELPARAGELEAAGSELAAMQGSPHLAGQHATLLGRTAALAATVKGLRREQAENRSLVDALARRLARLRRGERDDPRAHIAKLARPVSIQRMRFNRLAEGWAAVSLSLLLAAVVALYFVAREYLWLGVVILVLVFAVFESLLRGTFIRTVNRIAVFLAIVASLVLLVSFWVQIVVVALVAGAGFLLVQKVRELRS